MANTATLPCGAQVDTSSEEWRAWCEAKHVAQIKTKDGRSAYIERVKKRRGEEAATALRKGVLSAWKL